MLKQFEKEWNNIVLFVKDNCKVNKALSKKAAVPLIGCYSHRFNLAVQEILKDDNTLLGKVNNIMLKLRTIIGDGRLSDNTHLTAQTPNATRWSSTFSMMDR